MATPNLDIAEVAAAQAQKEVTINDAITALDNAINETHEFTVTGDFSIPLATLQGAAFIELAGTPTAAYTVTLPANKKRLFCVYNNSGQTATIGTIAFAATKTGFLYWDGTTARVIGQLS